MKKEKFEKQIIWFKKNKKMLISLIISITIIILISTFVNYSTDNTINEKKNTTENPQSSNLIGDATKTTNGKISIKQNDLGKKRSPICIDTEHSTNHFEVGTTTGLSKWYSINEEGEHVKNIAGDYTDTCNSERILTEYFCDDDGVHVTYDAVNCYIKYGVDYRCEENICVGGYYDFELSSFYAVPIPETKSIYILVNIEVNGNYTGNELTTLGDYWVQPHIEGYVDPIVGQNNLLLGINSIDQIEGNFNVGALYDSIINQGYINLTVSIDTSDETYELDETNNQETRIVYFN